MDITTLLTDLASVVHGTTVNKVPNIYGIINRAARQVLLDVDPKETQRIVQMPQIFNDTYDYAIPVDVKGDRIIDLALQAGRDPWDVFTQGYAENFDANKLVSFKNKIYTQWNTGVKTIRIEAPFLTSPVQLADTSSITGWAATIGAQNIQEDSTNFVSGGGAISFDLAAGHTSGYIESSTLNPVNLSSYANIATGFLWVYIPTATAVTSIDVRWGSDINDYYHYSTSVNQNGTSFVNGWNLLALPWVSATQVGTPNTTTMKYVRVTPTYNSTLQTSFRIDNLVFTLGYYFTLQYYSKYMFRNPSTNAFVEKVLDSSYNGYLINLDTESYNLLFNKTAFFIAQSLQGADAGYDANYWDSEYQASLTRYKAENPSETLLKKEQYYSIRNKGYNRYAPGIYNR